MSFANPLPAGLTIGLERLRAADHARVGGKAANLGELLHAGMPVPPGFCVTAEAYRRFLANSGFAEPIRSELRTMDLAHPEQAHAVAQRLRKRLSAASIPLGVEQAVTAAWSTYWPKHPEVVLAVRSSATAEDLPGASFAGQYDTFLKVCGLSALLRAVRDCWISLFSERALIYRARQHVDLDRVMMAVIVQELVPAQCAGVAFTADPVDAAPTRNDRIIIEATPGLGESLVAGKVSPDRIVLDKRTLAVLDQNIGAVSSDTNARLAPDARAQMICLPSHHARKLAELALQAERLFGVPQDVEWALTADRLWLLQSRPITAVAAPRPAAHAAQRAVWSNVNVGELMPEVATPMTWSIVKRTVDEVLTPILKLLGVDLTREPWFALIAGRVYANLSVFARIITALPGSKRMELVEAFGGHGAGAAEIERVLNTPDPRGLWRRRMALLARVPALTRWFFWHLSPEKGQASVAEYAAKISRVERQNVARMSEAQLADHLTALLRALHGDSQQLARQAIGCAGVGMALTNSLFQVTRRWFKDEHGTIANRLISGTGEMASAEAALGLWELAEWARQHPGIVKWLRPDVCGGDLLRALRRTAEGNEFLWRWAKWNACHGHHAYAELDVAQRRWSEDPAYVLALLQAYIATPPQAGPPARRAACERQHAQLLADCRSRLGMLRRPLFDFLLRRSRAGLALRENLKNELIRVVATARYALQEAGRRLEGKGILQTPDDIFFLEPEEADRLLRGTPDPDLVTQVAARRAEFSRYQQLQPPPVIVGEFDPSCATAAPKIADSNVLRGLAVSAGIATGPARVILRADGNEMVRPGEILIAPFTDPGWTPHFLTAAGLVVDMGGMFSHGSVVAREYGLPAVVNVGHATRLIRTGQVVTVDGNHGTVMIDGPPGATA